MKRTIYVTAAVLVSVFLLTAQICSLIPPEGNKRLDNGEVWCRDPDTDRCGDVQHARCIEAGGTVVSSCTDVPETEPDESACDRSF